MLTAHLTFSLSRAERLARLDGVELGTWLRRAAAEVRGRRELARKAGGVHTERSAALAYATTEGPAFILCPDGEIVRVERARDAAEDARIAADQRARAERLRRMTLRDELGRARP